jgi:hypothetical protein
MKKTVVLGISFFIVAIFIILCVYIIQGNKLLKLSIESNEGVARSQATHVLDSKYKSFTYFSLKSMQSSKDVLKRLSAVTLIHQLLKHQDVEIATYMPIYYNLCEDPNELVRNYCVVVDGDVFSENFVKLQRWLEDDSPLVKRTAALTLAVKNNFTGIPILIDIIDARFPAPSKNDALFHLRRLTGKSFEEKDEWKNWWETEGKITLLGENISD